MAKMENNSMSDTLSTVLAQLDPKALDMIGKKLGVDPQTVQQGVQIGLPVLLAALARNTQTADGAQSLAGALTRDHNGSALQNLPATINDYQQGPGDSILKHVLGDQRGQVEQGLSQQAGLDGGALLQMLAPMVLGALGQQQRQQDLNPTAIANSLQSQQQSIQAQQGGLFGLITQWLGGALGGTQQNPGTSLGGALGGGPLVQMIMGMFGPSLVAQLAQRLNVDPATVERALLIAIPLLLAALAHNASSQQGATSLHGALARDHTGGALQNLDQVLSNPQTNDGEKIIKHVLGDQAQNVAQNLTQQTGLDGGQLLQTLAPIVMGVLGQQTQQQGLDPNGLATTLQQEQTTLEQSDSGVMGTVRQVLGASEKDDGGGIMGLLGRLLGIR
jgi:hypothetical protein